MTAWEALRRIAVVVVAGPLLAFFGPIWFVVAGVLSVVIGLLMPNREPWYWRYAWGFTAFPFHAFWAALTGSDILDRYP